MKDEQCVRFLQWALPRLQMRWPGFRKVRRQVCKRLDRRLRDLGLSDIEAYRAYLQANSDEWNYLDPLCRITISRFYRDRAVFYALATEVLPSLAQCARGRGDASLRVWSVGCGSGEEPYSLAVIWAMELQPRFSEMSIEIIATDADPQLLLRARDALYKSSSVRELPASRRECIFTEKDGYYHLKPEYKHGVVFLKQDIRRQQPDGLFDLVLCRNLVFTYFDEVIQQRILKRIVGTMHDGGALAIGIHERLPDKTTELSAWFSAQGIYKKSVAMPAR